MYANPYSNQIINKLYLWQSVWFILPMQPVKSPIFLGSLFLSVYLFTFLTSSEFFLSMILFITCPFVVIWIVYKILDNGIVARGSAGEL